MSNKIFRYNVNLVPLHIENQEQMLLEMNSTIFHELLRNDMVIYAHSGAYNICRYYTIFVV